ncbi:MAG: arabinofuranosyltransferase [Caldilineaceae bacterium]
MRVYSFVSFAATTLCGFVLYSLIDHAPASIATHPWLDVWLEVALVTFVGGLLLLFALPVSERLRFDLTVGAVSLFLTATLALVLKNTPFTVGAVTGDQRFYTYFVTKFAAYPGYIDGVYRDLPSFYPPLYYYILGRLAALFHSEPYHTMKIGLLATIFLIPYLSTWLWRRLVDEKLAVAAAFALLLYQQWFKPAEWLSLVLFVPWWLYWVEDVTGQKRRSSLVWWLWGSLLGGLLFQTYYYWFFIGGVSLLLKLVMQVWQRGKRQIWQFDLRNVVALLGGAALLSSLYWGPYLYSMYRTGGWNPLQNRWLSDGKIPLPLPFLDDSVEGVVLLGGLLYLVVSAGSNRVSRGLLNLVIAVYVWAALGYIGILTDHPLLTFRAFPVIDYLLALAAGLALLRLWQEQLWQRFLPPTAAPLGRIAPALLVVLALFFGQNTGNDLLKDDNVQKALAAKAPQQDLAALDKLTQQQYLNKDFLLGNDYADLMAYRPFYSFLPWTATFSHPAGRFHERLDFLQRLAATSEPQLFAAALMNNRYSKVDTILATNKDNRWLFSFKDINFPNRTISRDFAFAAQLLTAPYFESKSEAGRTLITPIYAQNPLPALTPDQVASAPITTTRLLYALTGAFGPHIELPAQTALRTAAEQRLLQTDLTALPLAALLDLQQAADGPLAAKVRTALLDKLPQPLDVVLTDQAGVEKLRVLGYGLQAQATEAKKPVLTVYYEVLAPLEQDYTIWLHADQTGAQHNFDHAPNAATSAWRVGKIYQDVTVLNVDPGEYNISFGLWRSEEDVRLVQHSGDVGVELGVQRLP